MTEDYRIIETFMDIEDDLTKTDFIMDINNLKLLLPHIGPDFVISDTPIIFFAIECNNNEIINILLSNNVDCTCENKNKETVLNKLVDNEYYDHALKILKEKKYKFKMSLRYFENFHQFRFIMNNIIKDFDYKLENEKTITEHALESKNTVIINYLFDIGLNINKNIGNKFLIDYFIEHKMYDVIYNILVTKKVKLDKTLLCNFDILKFLVLRNIVNKDTMINDQPLIIDLVSENKDKCAEYLIQIEGYSQVIDKYIEENNIDPAIIEKIFNLKFPINCCYNNMIKDNIDLNKSKEALFSFGNKKDENVIIKESNDEIDTKYIDNSYLNSQSNIQEYIENNSDVPKIQFEEDYHLNAQLNTSEYTENNIYVVQNNENFEEKSDMITEKNKDEIEKIRSILNSNLLQEYLHNTTKSKECRQNEFEKKIIDLVSLVFHKK